MKSATESFPRLWDQPALSLSHLLKRRIIPTYVGSTKRHRFSVFCCSNHSHVCGINMIIDSVQGKIVESFPRMWDQLVAESNCLYCFRIIPTYVESTTAFRTLCCTLPNHSHVCGINYLQSYNTIVCGRIIPTYVGSTLPC